MEAGHDSGIFLRCLRILLWRRWPVSRSRSGLLADMNLHVTGYGTTHYSLSDDADRTFAVASFQAIGFSRESFFSWLREIHVYQDPDELREAAVSQGSADYGLRFGDVVLFPEWGRVVVGVRNEVEGLRSTHELWSRVVFGGVSWC